MLRKNFFPVLCSFFLIFSACTKDVGKLPVSSVAPSGCDTVTYTKHIKPLMDASCNLGGCHGIPLGSGAPPFSNYAQVKQYADNGEIKSTVFDSQPELMPQNGPPLPQAQKNLLNCWLNNGKKE